jgi:large subunit ribosomal protein L16
MQINKSRKLQKITVEEGSLDYKRINLLYGFYGLKALESIRLKDMQLESAKKTIKKVIKKTGILWVLIKANRPVTQKPQQVRMGKGKGAYSYSVAIVQKGTILFELGGLKLSKKLAYLALKLAAGKLPIKTEICVYKN